MRNHEQAQARHMDALDQRVEALLQESAHDAERRAEGVLERAIPDFQRVWIEGRGILARRVSSVARAAGLEVVGTVSDLEGVQRQLQAWRRGWAGQPEGASILPPDFSLLNTRAELSSSDPNRSWEDFCAPSCVHFHALAWRFPELAHGELFVGSPKERLQAKQDYRAAWRQLSSLAARMRFLSRFSALLAWPSQGEAGMDADPMMLEEQRFPTPLPSNPLGDLSLRFQAPRTEWVYDFCRPNDPWCEQELRLRDPSGWRRLRFHPQASQRPGDARSQVCRGWLWPRAKLQDRPEAANQGSGERHQDDQYRRDYAQALGIDGTITAGLIDSEAWSFLCARPPELRCVLRLQGFSWEALCPELVNALADLLIEKPGMELRWESPHAIDILAALSTKDELRSRVWDLESTLDPRLDAAILRRSGR